MKRLVVIALATAGAALGILAILSASGSAQAPGRTLQLFERERGSSFGFVDNRPKVRNRRNPRLSVGDVFAFSSPVFDQSRATRLGTLSVHCTVTRPGREARSEAACVGAFRLRDGIIALTTSISGQPRRVEAAVTGGTGAYTGARGTLVSTTVRGGSEDTITLLP
jgi:hypothetical protein